MVQSDGYRAFISYASPDRDKAFELCRLLEAQGLRCWIAPRDVRAGREYGDEIVQGIERSSAFILVFSAQTNDSPFVRREVERAVSKKKPLFPFRVEDAKPAAGLEFFVSATHWIDAYEGDFAGHAAYLARDLKDGEPGSLGSAPLPPRPMPPTPNVPAAKGPGLTVGGRALLLGVAAALGFGLALALFFALQPPSEEVRTERDAPAQTPSAEDDAKAMDYIHEGKRLLATFGYFTGSIAETSGPRFSEGLRQFQADHGLPLVETIDKALIEDIREIYAAAAPAVAAQKVALARRERAAYEDFLARYPKGPLAEKVREALATCRMGNFPVREKVSEPVSATGTGEGADAAAACQAATTTARASLRQLCGAGQLSAAAESVEAGASGVSGTTCLATLSATCTTQVTALVEREFCN